MRIKNKKKFIRGILIILAIVALVKCRSILSYTEPKYDEIYISNGETLWEIAKVQQSTNEYYKDKDIREIVYNIKTINNLENSNLYEGQKLLVMCK